MDTVLGEEGESSEGSSGKSEEEDNDEVPVLKQNNEVLLEEDDDLVKETPVEEQGVALKKDTTSRSPESPLLYEQVPEFEPVISTLRRRNCLENLQTIPLHSDEKLDGSDEEKESSEEEEQLDRDLYMQPITMISASSPSTLAIRSKKILKHSSLVIHRRARGRQATKVGVESASQVFPNEANDLECQRYWK